MPLAKQPFTEQERYNIVQFSTDMMQIKMMS